ncbi:MAG TPA: FKBP-type peptidyl-prolyl cis-trans isomerase [Mucilaginibacter sp.]|jgi:FKBP-type peptidyl-prolyl cis-trans isomerase FkpA|nr:FKBP-type peptidyl-prolyl cis-trans isomerase [Mucilaginibacter sp.]
MKRYLFLTVLLVAGLSACTKIDTNTLMKDQAVIDDQKIQEYIKANHITVTKDEKTGVYYNVIIQGTDPKPTALSTVKLTYTYKYLSGLSIGTVTGAQAKLNTFVPGVQVGILKIGTGGRVLLIVPSGQAYGYGATGGIPGNSVLVYTIDLDGIGIN